MLRMMKVIIYKPCFGRVSNILLCHSVPRTCINNTIVFLIGNTIKYIHSLSMSIHHHDTLHELTLNKALKFVLTIVINLISVAFVYLNVNINMNHFEMIGEITVPLR